MKRLFLGTLLVFALACGGSAEPGPGEGAEGTSGATESEGETSVEVVREDPAEGEAAEGETAGATPTETEGAEAQAEGPPCSTSDDCPDGTFCIGPEGCDVQWTCQPFRPCTRDLRPYCGCDGQTFQSSGTCPERPYAHRGPCEG